MNEGFPGFTATWIVPAVLAALALVVAGVIVLAIIEERRGRVRHPARTPGRHEHGTRAATLTAGARVRPAVRGLPSDRSRRAALSALAEPCPACGDDHIGDCPLPERWSNLPAHLRPGVVLPATPRLAPALEPLPDEHRNCREVGGCGPECPWCAYPDITGDKHDLTITAGPGADEAYADVVSAGIHDGKTRPGIEPTTGEIFEHVHEGERCWCLPWKPAPLPQAVVRELKHPTVDEAMDSIVLRAEEAERFRAELEARLAQDDAAHANGQVSSGA